MPNYITNKVKIISDKKSEIFKFMKEAFNNEGRFNYYNYKEYYYFMLSSSIEALMLTNNQNSKFNNTNKKKYIKKEKKHYIFEFNVIKEISKKFKFKIKFADEEVGPNCGYYTIKNGKIRKEKIAPKINKQKIEGTIYKWLKFSCKLIYDTHPAYLGYDINGEVCKEVEKNTKDYIKKIKIKKTFSKKINKF